MKQEITPDLLEELIELLKDPNSLRKDKRFELLERAFLLKNDHKKGKHFYKKLELYNVAWEVDRLHRTKVLQEDINHYINNL